MDGNNAKSQRKIYELGMDAPGKGNKVIRSLWDDIKATSTVSLNTSTVSAMR